MKNLMRKITSEYLVFFPYFENLKQKGAKGFFSRSLENIEDLNNIDIDEHIDKIISQKNTIEEIIYILADEEKSFYIDMDNFLWIKIASYDTLKNELEIEIDYQKELNYIIKKKEILKNQLKKKERKYNEKNTNAAVVDKRRFAPENKNQIGCREHNNVRFSNRDT
jgi:hypothetical protein